MITTNTAGLKKEIEDSLTIEDRDEDMNKNDIHNLDSEGLGGAKTKNKKFYSSFKLEKEKNAKK